MKHPIIVLKVSSTLAEIGEDILVQRWKTEISFIINYNNAYSVLCVLLALVREYVEFLFE